VYGIRKDRLMEFEWNPHTPTNNGCYYCRPAICQTKDESGNEYWEDDATINGATCACKPVGGYTHTARHIEFASIWPNDLWPDEPGRQQLRQVNNVIHELGHAFNNRLGKIPENAVKTAIDNEDLPDVKPKGFYEAGTVGNLILDWIQSSSNDATEVFADQFIGWVYGKWADDKYGRLRRDFMDKHMRHWIEQAMKGGE
jgi:hypothetical protein